MIDLGIDINPKTMVLVVSDVHLGALHAKQSLFELFLSSLLNKLEREELPDLKALIILGDCFDLIMDSYDDLLQFGLYQKIYDKFEELHQMDDVRLIFALGNHEIPVNGDYNNTFANRTDAMLDNFSTKQKEMDLEYSFFKRKNFSQYVLLQQQFGKPEPQINLYDREQDILNIGPQPPDLNHYLMAHGFQYDPSLDFFAGFWNLALANPFSFIKQIGDGIWNGLIKKIYEKSRRIIHYTQDEIDNINRKLLKKYTKKYKIELNDEQKQQLDADLEAKWNSEEHREAIRDNKGCINEIVKKIPKFVENNIPINHVIYGHTHDRLREIYRFFSGQTKAELSNQQFQFKVPLPQQNDFSISNTGAWQHVKKPSFIEIHTDWEVVPQVVPLVIGEYEEIVQNWRKLLIV